MTQARAAKGPHRRQPRKTSDGVRVRFRVRFQAVKVQIFGGFPVESPTKKANRLKALLRGISLSKYDSEGFRVRLRRVSEYGSVAYLVERPTRETQAEQSSDTVLVGPYPCPTTYQLSVILNRDLQQCLVLPFLVLGEFLGFSPCEDLVVFLSVFPLFQKILGSVGNSFFYVGFPCLTQKN